MVSWIGEMVADRLLNRFNIPRPRVIYDSSFIEAPGLYYPDTSTIVLRPNAEDAVLIHELGHHIFHLKNSANSICSKCEKMIDCEAYAKKLESWYIKTYDIPSRILEYIFYTSLSITGALIAGTLLAPLLEPVRKWLEEELKKWSR